MDDLLRFLREGEAGASQDEQERARAERRMRADKVTSRVAERLRAGRRCEVVRHVRASQSWNTADARDSVFVVTFTAEVVRRMRANAAHAGLDVGTGVGIIAVDATALSLAMGLLTIDDAKHLVNALEDVIAAAERVAREVE